jgi:hypothetical protein
MVVAVPMVVAAPLVVVAPLAAVVPLVAEAPSEGAVVAVAAVVVDALSAHAADDTVMKVCTTITHDNNEQDTIIINMRPGLADSFSTRFES